MQSEPPEAGKVIPERGAWFERGFEQCPSGSAGVSLAKELRRGLGEDAVIVGDRD
jgi:hypothetical protein